MHKTKSGFTIVELLIVIVVIGILAAITIVAYNGIQNRAKENAGLALASSIAKKLEAYNAINGSYPVTQAQMQGLPESKIDNISESLLTSNGTGLSGPAVAADTANSGKTVRITGSSASGSVRYWKYASTGEGVVPYGG